jgi:hypothetical protein
MVRFGNQAFRETRTIFMADSAEYLRVREPVRLLDVCPSSILAGGGKGRISEYHDRAAQAR